MNNGHQFARRKGGGTIKNKPATATPAYLLKPQRPTARTNRAVSPPKPRHSGKATGDYRKTASPATMPQRINTRTRETVYSVSHRVTHNINANPTAQYTKPVTTTPTLDGHGQTRPHQVAPQTARDSCHRAKEK